MDHIIVNWMPFICLALLVFRDILLFEFLHAFKLYLQVLLDQDLDYYLLLVACVLIYHPTKILGLYPILDVLKMVRLNYQSPPEPHQATEMEKLK